jgi:hypothetical protein
MIAIIGSDKLSKLPIVVALIQNETDETKINSYLVTNKLLDNVDNIRYVPIEPVQL